MHAQVKALIDHFQFDTIPLEGTFYRRTYTARETLPNGIPAGTAIMGMYCHHPFSGSFFHRVSRDETWHFYKGDPFTLFLFYEDGLAKEVVMGPDVLAGQSLQFTVPAGVWQAGLLHRDGVYALFGCTVTPGFTGDCFEAGLAEELANTYPQHREIIEKLCHPGKERWLPKGYDG
jgi:predicted cupin superfamily sugar epimerase